MSNRVCSLTSMEDTKTYDTQNNNIQDVQGMSVGNSVNTAVNESVQKSKRKLVILVFVIITILGCVEIGLFFFIKSRADWREKIIPGQTTQSQLEKIIGKSTQISEGSLGATYQHLTPADRGNATIVFDDKGLVSFVGIYGNAGEPETRARIEKKYGKTKHELSRKVAEIPIPILIYPEQGIAFTIDASNDKVVEVAYFQKMSIETFKSLYGGNFQ